MGLTDGDGYALARIARALAVSRGSIPQAHAYAEAQYGSTSLVTRILTRGVIDIPSLGGDDGNAAAASNAFVTAKRLSPSLVEAINSASTFAPVPFVCPFLTVNGGAMIFWTREGTPIKTMSAAFETKRLPVLKEATIIVMSSELLRLIGPAGDQAVNRILQRAANQTESEAFISPDNAGIDGTEPASITHDATSTAATGDIAADIKALIAGFEGDLTTSVFVMGPALAVNLALLGASLGAADIGVAQVGTLAGIPALTHSAVREGDLVLLDPAMIAMAPRIFVTDVSNEASLEVANDNDEGSSLVSLWQQDLSSTRLVEYCNWYAPPGSVSMLTGIGNISLANLPEGTQRNT